MAKTPIKNFYHQIIGWIDTDSAGNKKAFDFYHRLLGSYNATTNLTKDFYNRIVGRGDLTSALIVEADAKIRAERQGGRK